MTESNTAYDPTDLRGQEEARAEREEIEKLSHESEASDMQWLMGSKRGRRIVWRLLDQAGVFRLSYSPNAPNAMQTAFNEGNRNYGNKTLSLIHSTCPDLYPVMVKENNYASKRSGGGSTGKYK